MTSQLEKSRTIKVLVVDDSAFMRKVISEMLEEADNIEVIDRARNGIDALRKLEKCNPDVITLDVEMPKMDGLQFLEKLVQVTGKSIPVVMLSSLTTKQSKTTIKALELGAVDFVAKPSGSISLDINKVQEKLIEKVRLAAKAKVKLDKAPSLSNTSLSLKKRKLKRINRNKKNLSQGQRPASNKKLVVIGASTGGPRALKEVVTLLPEDLNAEILIIQHMPPGFTTSLAERLNKLSKIKVKEAQEGDRLEKGLALLAPGDYHMVIERGKVSLSQSDKVHNVRPAVDITMESVIAEYGNNIVGVLLTGMGKDGAEGLKLIRDAGGQTIAQDEESCVVYGMPKAAYELGAVDVVKSIDDIAVEIVRRVNS
ncbi:protein-glutamate methylesterase/protein-glutamine glutaminase [Orenia marismortui]|uniref:Protein-glutamate methylesterase/protein-glutamine glutaminase n=1 Tax=Orenia marismortui TaxID=46469 RepID=A0A4R8GY74_9FIRM|nr:chemotaxis response regulator protein-glutamate methylesterase [Orenia marismortui]TDX51359.1 two-component system chemotaxis response regulator CheB [Orenia marismortui]